MTRVRPIRHKLSYVTCSPHTNRERSADHHLASTHVALLSQILSTNEVPSILHGFRLSSLALTEFYSFRSVASSSACSMRARPWTIFILSPAPTTHASVQLHTNIPTTYFYQHSPPPAYQYLNGHSLARPSPRVTIVLDTMVHHVADLAPTSPPPYTHHPPPSHASFATHAPMHSPSLRPLMPTNITKSTFRIHSNSILFTISSLYSA